MSGPITPLLHHSNFIGQLNGGREKTVRPCMNTLTDLDLEDFKAWAQLD